MAKITLSVNRIISGEAYAFGCIDIDITPYSSTSVYGIDYEYLPLPNTLLYDNSYFSIDNLLFNRITILNTKKLHKGNASSPTLEELIQERSAKPDLFNNAHSVYVNNLRAYQSSGEEIFYLYDYAIVFYQNANTGYYTPLLF